MAQIILDSNNNLIQGDFDNATLNNRTKLQTTTTNATTNVYVVPNGSSTSAGVSVANNSSLTNASKIVMATNGTTDTQIISGVNGSGSYLPLNFYTNNALSMTIDTANNVGIGTASPNGRLSVASPSTAQAITIWNRASDNTYGGIYFKTSDGATDQFALINERSSTNGAGLLFYAKPNGGSITEAMRIDSSGNVGIGNTSPTYKLDILSGTSNALSITTNNTNTTILNLTRSNVSTVTHTIDNTGYKLINGGSGGVYLGFTGTSWISLSDERFKTDLKPIENAAEKVSTLRAVTGRFKSDTEGKSRSFLIAQDIQAVLPEAVDTSDPEQLGVSYTDTIPLLVAAIKEQQTIINELKTRIEALESK
jgi:hypothetical protein